MSTGREQPRYEPIKQNPVGIRQGPFIARGSKRTRLKSEDELVLLGDGSPGNLGLLRNNGDGMSIQFQYAVSPFRGKAFSEEEAYFIAMGLAVGAGLDFEVSVAQNGSFPECRNVTFRFVPLSAS